MEQRERMPVEVCEPGLRCIGCPMTGRPNDIRPAIPGAINKIYAEHAENQWANPALASIVTPSALYAIGIERPSIAQLRAVRIAVQRIAITGECTSYGIDGEKHVPYRKRE